jgi:hypothetical protein
MIICRVMSNKPGRNDPCPCGSGKKYKRCCLQTEEAAARERTQQALFADDPYGDVEHAEDDFDEEFGDLDEDLPTLDVHAITRVRYTRGFVHELSDLHAGGGLRVTEWEAPLPAAILDSIEQEGADGLEGEWGDPEAADPIQVDLIDLETEADVVSIEVFNRAIALIQTDDEEMQRIHRLCGVLDVATPEARDPSAAQSTGKPTLMVFRREEVRPPADEFDLSGVLKEHRRQGGTCELCGDALTRRTALKHAGSCAPEHDPAKGPEQQLVHLRATAPGLPAYWLDLEVKADAKLEALDSFLRGIWLECCGHLSVFKIGTVDYFSRGYDFGFTRGLGSLGRRSRAERSMSVSIRNALSFDGERIDYEYDFGSTTSLEIKAIGERTGRAGRSSVRLLARNTAPVWPCAVCGQPAAIVCAYCLQSEGNPFMCMTHRREHACGDDGGFLPVVNSPRMGVCGYGCET